MRRLRSWTPQEPEIERREHQNNPDIYYQPFPELVPEKQDVHADHDGYQREHVEHDGCPSSHRPFLPPVIPIRICGTSLGTGRMPLWPAAPLPAWLR